MQNSFLKNIVTPLTRRASILYVGCILFTALVMVVLFYQPYSSVKKKTITSFQNEQMLRANGVVKGIQSFFDTYAAALRHLSVQEAIRDFDDSGPRIMQDFYTVHGTDISAITRIDADGRIMYTVPRYDNLIGEDVSHQPHNRQIILTHETVVSDVFATKQGFDSVAFAYPIFKGEEYAGCLTLLIPFKKIAARYLETLAASDTAMAFMLSKNGVVLYNPRNDQFHAETSIEKYFADTPPLLAMAKKMIAHKQGKEILPLPGDTQPFPQYAVYTPINLPGNNYWSIFLATPENDVLAAMTQFRNLWLISSSAAFCFVLFLSYFLGRSLIRSREEKRNRAAEEQMVRVLDFTPVGLVVSSVTGPITYANKTALSLFPGLHEETILGRKIEDFILPQYRASLARQFQQLLSGQPANSTILEMKAPDGERKEIEVSSAPFTFKNSSGLISILRDVTAVRKMEESRRRLVTAIEQVRESVIITDKDGNIEYINPAFTENTGYTEEEVLGKNPRLLNSGHHSRNFFKTMWKTLNEGEVWKGRIVNRHKDGTLFTEQATISKMQDESSAHFVAVKRDITHEMELETQLRQAQKMEALGTLAGGIAHDFNNILGAILGFTDMALLEAVPGSSVHDDLLHIRKGGKRAADLVLQILTFSRQSGLEKIPVAVIPLLKESLKLLRATLPTTIRIELEACTKDVHVLADPIQIQQIIMNLCTNASYAMREKGGEIRVLLQLLDKTQADKTDMQPLGKTMELIIKDTGVGMDQPLIDRIFDPFFTTKGLGEGTGMGLSVVHGIVLDLGGKISVESQPGTGTIFRVLLPTVEKDPDKKGEDGLPVLRGGNEHILVVDDEEEILKTSQMMLSHLGYQVSLCTNGEEALELCADPETSVDLVITDQTMPGMTGMTLIKQLQPLRPELPVILCTGYSDTLNDETAQQAGARLLLLKPVELQKLSSSIRTLLDDIDH